MGETRDTILTTSFVKLRRLVVGFDHLADGRPTTASEEKALRRVATQLGPVALRVLLAELGAPDDSRARWAHTLLMHMGRGAELRARIVRELGDLVRRSDAPDRAKLRGLTALAELEAELPSEANLADPDDARRRSLHELALCLDSPAGVARAADHLVEGLAFEELLDLFDELVESEPASAMALLDELLVRDELDESCRHELRQRRAAARPSAGRAGGSRRPAPVTRTRFARHADGRRILLACARQPGSRPPRRRLLCLLVGSDGVLLDGHYAEDLTAGAIERQFAAPLAEQGFALEPAGRDAARGFLIQAARLAIQAGRMLPRAFYLGRDLIGLRDEHLDGTRRGRGGEGELAALLDRGIELLGAGEAAAARPLLERYVAEAPDDPEGHGQLGLCHMSLGDVIGALHHLGRATWLAPDEPLYHWNTAAAAHVLGQRGACYLALRAYLDGADTTPGNRERASTARRFLHEYERLALLEHPGVSAEELALAEAGRAPEPTRRRSRREG